MKTASSAAALTGRPSNARWPAAAESGSLVTITRHERPVVHVISAARLGGMIETMELLADPRFMAQLKKLRTGKLKFHPASTLAD